MPLSLPFPPDDEPAAAADRIDCETAIRELPDLLDREVSPHRSAAVERHLAECARCLRKYRFERTLLDGLRRRLGRSEAPVGFVERVVALVALARNGGRGAGAL